MDEEYNQKCDESRNLNNLTESLHLHLTQITKKYKELDEAYKELQNKQNLYNTKRANSPLM